MLPGAEILRNLGSSPAEAPPSRIKSPRTRTLSIGAQREKALPQKILAKNPAGSHTSCPSDTPTHLGCVGWGMPANFGPVGPTSVLNQGPSLYYPSGFPLLCLSVYLLISLQEKVQNFCKEIYCVGLTLSTTKWIR